MADNTAGGAGDTLEFLKIMGMGAPSADADAARPADGKPARDKGRGVPEVTFSDMPPVEAAPLERPGQDAPEAAPARPRRTSPEAAPARPRGPVVIKGGPRRVVRADGRQPETSYALGQRRFALSSGHAMFAPKKQRNVLRESLIAVACLLAVAAIFVAVWFAAQASVTRDEQEAMTGTTAYDSALSLTPAVDGGPAPEGSGAGTGYYTVFLVTSTDTDETHIGDLSQILMYRHDKGVTTAMRVSVPTNLYVAPDDSTTGAAQTVQQTLADQSIVDVLDAIDHAFGIRLYNVICCQQSVFDQLYAVATGAADASSVDPSSLLGSVYSNLALEDVVGLCAQFGALDQSTVADRTVPTAGIDVNGTVMAQGSEALWQLSLRLGSTLPGNAQLDANGNLAGTQYDEAGNAILDESGAPAGALRGDGNNLVFDENGYLQFYGQQYDANNMPVGTQYDENGNPILDGNGNPLGTQYDENGNVVVDWRGNMVIQAG